MLKNGIERTVFDSVVACVRIHGAETVVWVAKERTYSRAIGHSSGFARILVNLHLHATIR